MKQAVEKKDMETAVFIKETEEKLRNHEAAMRQAVEKKDTEAVVLKRETEDNSRLTSRDEQAVEKKDMETAAS